jgi:hypothetical protein
MCDYSNQADVRKQALADMVRDAEDANLYDLVLTPRDVEEAIKRVRQLHRRDVHNYCSHCYGYMGTSAFYPCPTVKALDGEQ